MAAMEETKISDFDNGLRILARMIARVYLKDLAIKPIQSNLLGENKEGANANKRCDRGCKTSQIGENQAGD
jgi:hypothetical protein